MVNKIAEAWVSETLGHHISPYCLPGFSHEREINLSVTQVIFI